MRDASEVIAPCPFCGGQAEIHEVDDDRHDGWRGVGCGKCRCFMAEPGVPDAIAAWNKRATLSAAEPADAGRDAVAWMHPDYAAGHYPHGYSPVSTYYTKGWIPLYYARPPSEAAAVDDAMAQVGELIRTQDNRITDSPIFAVQQKRWIGGVDPDYGGERVWINHARESCEITDEAEIDRLDALYAEDYCEPEGYTLTGKMHVWEFVTACFTEQGCKDYIARDGHNLKEPRIFAYGSYRNEEWRAVRKHLMALASQQAVKP